MEAPCSRCGKVFTLTPKQKHNLLREGRKVYCSQDCMIVGRGHVIGGHRAICKTCGKEFVSRIAGKIYCNMKCYWADPESKDRLRKRNKKRAEGKTIEVKCDYCGSPLERLGSSVAKARHRFCNHSHYRRYLADRFDRWIASPQAIALPQNYDEFLSQEELPCLVDGCDWVGQNLSYHMNITHGVPAREFKKMAGFNLGSGIVTPDVSDKMREAALARGINGLVPGVGGHERGDYESLEGREHAIKTRALLAADPENVKIGICERCHSSMIMPAVGTRKYCSTECRDAEYKERNAARIYPLVCGMCGKGFNGNIAQKRRERRGLAVFCCPHCRQENNSPWRKK